jgi:hypothetical protein
MEAMTQTDLIHSDADFSLCRTWRYSLTRTWRADRGTIVFIGLNPSSADEVKNDPTVSRCIGFARRWGYGGMVMLNAFAYRATDPKDLKKAPDPVGPHNDYWILIQSFAADVVVGCWGNHGRFRDRETRVVELVPRLLCFGKTKLGCPKHPLYLPGDAKLEPF